MFCYLSQIKQNPKNNIMSRKFMNKQNKCNLKITNSLDE